jgi:hypothetical protein
VSNLAAGLDESFLALVDDAIRGGLVLEPNDGRLLLFNSEGTWNNRERGSDERKKSHVESGIGDSVIGDCA